MTSFGYVASTRGTSEYRINETHRLWVPYGWEVLRSGPPIILAPGFGGSPDVYDDTLYDEIPIVLARRLYAPVMSATWGVIGDPSEAFGNDDAVDAVGDGLSWLNTTYGVDISRVITFGGSMGVLTTLNWAWRNPSQIIASILTMPAINLENLYNEGSYASEIDEAYPATLDETDLDDHDPSRNTELITWPVRSYYGDADTLIPYQDVIDWCEFVGSNAEPVSLGDVGHGTGLPSGMDMDEVCDWVVSKL